MEKQEQLKIASHIGSVRQPQAEAAFGILLKEIIGKSTGNKNIHLSLRVGIWLGFFFLFNVMAEAAERVLNFEMPQHFVSLGLFLSFPFFQKSSVASWKSGRFLWEWQFHCPFVQEM